MTKGKSTQVEYMIINPISNSQLDLLNVFRVKITTIVPTHVEEGYKEKMGRALEQGYDLFNSNSPIYNDVCTTFSNKDGIDVPNEIRKNEYFDKEMILCQDGCKYGGTDPITFKIKCDCEVKEEVKIEKEKQETDKKDEVSVC